MSDIQSYVEECNRLIASGSSRDDIDLYLKKKACDAKTAAAVHLVLQPQFVKKERISQRREEAWSNIAAGIVILLVAALFSIYTFIISEYKSLGVSLIMLYFSWKYISKGKSILNNLNDEKSIFHKSDRYKLKR